MRVGDYAESVGEFLPRLLQPGNKDLSLHCATLKELRTLKALANSSPGLLQPWEQRPVITLRNSEGVAYAESVGEFQPRVASALGTKTCHYIAQL